MKRIKKIATASLVALSMFGTSVAVNQNLNYVEAVETGDFTFTVSFCDADTNDVIAIKTITVNGEDGKQTLMDISEYMPEGYEVDGQFTQSTQVEVTPYGDGFNNTKQVYVKKVATETVDTTLQVDIWENTSNRIATRYLHKEGVKGETVTFTNEDLEKELPNGIIKVNDVEYKVTGQLNKTVEAGSETTVSISATKVEVSVKTVLNVTFETVYGEKVGQTTADTTAVGGEGEAWTFMLGTDFNLPEGYQLAEGVEQVTNIQVPFGATAGHTVIVEPIPAEEVKTVLNVTFETVYGEKVGEKTAYTTAVGGEGEAWTFMLGTDFDLPEGYQLAEGVEQATNIQVPFGAIGGHTMIVEPIPGQEVRTVLNVTFETVYGEKVGQTTADTTAVGGEGEAWTFMLGTDFDLPEGYQLAEGVEQVTNIQVPFGATGGHTMIVEPIPAEEVRTTLTITFETADGTKVGEETIYTTAVGGEGEAWTFMLGTDFNLPEGYQLAEGVEQVTNIQVPFGAIGGHTMIVEPVVTVDPEEPDVPETPEEPTDPDIKVEEPEVSDKTEDNNVTVTDKNSEKETTKTGDNSNALLYAVPMTISMLLVLAILRKKKLFLNK